MIRANLQKGEAVYINAGIMGLCVACLNVALGVGAEVFIGFSGSTEKKYLKETFSEVHLNILKFEKVSLQKKIYVYLLIL